MSITVYVTRVNIPAWSTIGHGWGKTADGREIEFEGDHRAMRHLGEALSQSDEPIPATIESWQVSVDRAPQEDPR